MAKWGKKTRTDGKERRERKGRGRKKGTENRNKGKCTDSKRETEANAYNTE